MSRRYWIPLIVLGAIWGSSYLFIKIGLRDLSPGMVSFLRIGLGAVVLAALAAARGALRGFSGKWSIIFVLAAVQVVAPFLLIAAGEQHISSSLTGILVTSAPLFTALLAIWVDQAERSQGSRLAGIALGAVGVAVLLGVDLGGSGNELLGGLAVVLAGLGYAVGGFIVKHRLKDHPPLGVAGWVMIASTVLMAPALFVGAPSEVPAVGPILAILALGVLGTGLAFAIFYDLIARFGPARAFVVTYLAPGFAVVYGALLLGEEITVATIAGLLLILAGSYLAAEGRIPLRRRRPALGPVAEDGGGGVALVPAVAAEGAEVR